MECPRCLSASPEGFRFCGQCGSPLRPQASPTAPTHDQAERRHLTVMFCDLVGSVALSTALDPEEFRDLLNQYLTSASAVARSHTGFIGQFHGDGMLVYFGYPKAREDSAILGVRAGLGILRALTALNAEAGSDLRVRIGLHTGLLVVGELGTGEGRESSVVVGKTPNLAARLQSLAQPGTVVISSDTWKLVRSHFRCQSLGEHLLKGLAEPLAVYQVEDDLETNAPRPVPVAFTALHGRGPDLARLTEAWALAIAGGAPRLAVIGEAGLGKSRLVHEFIQALAPQAHTCLIARGSAAAQNSAFEPLLQLLRELADILRGDSPAEQLEKIEAYLTSHGLPREAAIPLAAALTPDEPSPADAARHLSPSGIRQRLIAWLPTLLRALSARRPVLFVVEDLHWLDPSTLEALAHLFALEAQPRVFLCVTARPDFSAPWLPADQLQLRPLAAAEIAGVVEEMSGGKDLPAEVLRQIVAKTNGIPLFIEETTRMILESGLLVERESHFETRAPLPPMAIPDSLHELLMARLDGTTTVRAVAQIAAVIGMEFDYPTLHALWLTDSAVLDEQLARLVAAGLLTQSGPLHQAQFAFRHALIRQEAYQSLLKRKRQHYHERIAAVIAETSPATLRQRPELVAHHFTEAGRHAEAIELWLQAAIRSEHRCANAEAIAQADAGLALLPALADAALRGERELGLTVIRGRAAAMLSGYASEEVERTYFHARELCRGRESHPELYQVLAVLHAYYTARADFTQASEMAEQMMQLGEATSNVPILDNAWLSRGTNAFYLGDLERSLECFDHAIALYSAQPGGLPQRTLDIKVAALGWGGLAHILRGRPDVGLRWSFEARAHALQIEHLHSIAFARHFIELAHYWRDEPEGVSADAESFVEFCRDQGFVYWLSLGLVLQGWALTRLGVPEAFAFLARGLNIWQRTGARLGNTQHLSIYADALGRRGAVEEALAAIQQAEEFETSSGEACYSSHVAEVKAHLLRQYTPRDLAAVEASLRHALDRAHQTHTPWLALRASHSLASLLAELNRPAEARTTLESALAAIEGGEATPVVQAARRLLSALG